MAEPQSPKQPFVPRRGMIVWYQDQYQGEPLAAVITHVWPGEKVLNLCVFMQRGDPVGFTRISRSDSAPTPGTWRPEGTVLEPALDRKQG